MSESQNETELPDAGMIQNGVAVVDMGKPVVGPSITTGMAAKRQALCYMVSARLSRS